MNTPANRDQGRSRVAHLRKIIARDACEEGLALRTPPELELEALTAAMDARFPGWDAPPPPPEYPPTLKGCKRLATRLRGQMTAEGASKRTRAGFRAQLDELEAHIRLAFPEAAES